MNIEFLCSKCMTPMKAPLKYVGKVGKCRKCLTRVRIPNAEQAKLQRERATPPAHEPRPADSRRLDPGATPPAIRNVVLEGQPTLVTTNLFVSAISLFVVLLAVFGNLPGFFGVRNNESHLLLFIVGIVGVPMLIRAALSMMRVKKSVKSATQIWQEGCADFTPDVPELREYQGKRYEVLYQSPILGRQSRDSALLIRVPAVTPTVLHFNDENWFDRLCKRVGIAREHETGDSDFDEVAYVRGPSNAFVEKFLESHDRRGAILGLMNRGFCEVRLTGENVEAVWPRFDLATDNSPQLIPDSAKELFVLAENLPSHSNQQTPVRFDHRSFYNILLWVIASAFAAMVVFLFVYPPVREWELALCGLMAFAVGYALFGWVSALLLRGTSKSHDRWARLMSLGVLLIGLGSCGTVAAVNGFADLAPSEIRTATVSEKWTERRRRSSSPTHFVTVPCWNRPLRSLDFQVPSLDYERVAPGRSVLEVTTGRGLLGIEWVKGTRVR